MTKKQLLIRISAILLISIAFLFLIFIDPYQEPKDNNLIGLVDTKKDFYLPISKEELLSIFGSNETKIIYLGKIEKEYFDILDVLYTVSKKSGIKNVYYLDIEEERDILKYENKEVTVVKKSTGFYDKLIEKVGSFTEVYALHNEYNELVDSGYKIIYTPMVMVIKNGKIVFTHYVENINMSKEELEELKSIYVKGFGIINNL